MTLELNGSPHPIWEFPNDFSEPFAIEDDQVCLVTVVPLGADVKVCFPIDETDIGRRHAEASFPSKIISQTVELRLV